MAGKGPANLQNMGLGLRAARKGGTVSHSGRMPSGGSAGTPGVTVPFGKPSAGVFKTPTRRTTTIGGSSRGRIPLSRHRG